MPLNLFIIGPSGCGKSTQAKLIADKYHLTRLSMGQLLRDEIASGSELGFQAQASVDQGVWTPDSVTFPVLINALAKINSRNFIVDGFPRLVGQGVFIDAHLDSLGSKTDLLIHLISSQEELARRRLSAGAAFQPADRTDLTPEAIAQRQKSYDDTINPILDYYRNQNKLFEVDGNRPIEPIFSDICQRIDQLTND